MLLLDSALQQDIFFKGTAGDSMAGGGFCVRPHCAPPPFSPSSMGKSAFSPKDLVAVSLTCLDIEVGSNLRKLCYEMTQNVWN